MRTAPKANAKKAPAAAHVAPSRRALSLLPCEPHSGLVEMQRTIGNHALSQLMQTQGANTAVDGIPPIVQGVLGSGRGQSLDPSTRAFMESRFGEDFGLVRIHTDAVAGASARAVKANSYAVGHQLVFDTGRYAPATPAGRKLLAHELAHVIQQRRGGPSQYSTGADSVLEGAARKAALDVESAKPCSSELEGICETGTREGI